MIVNERTDGGWWRAASWTTKTNTKMTSVAVKTMFQEPRQMDHGEQLAVGCRLAGWYTLGGGWQEAESGGLAPGSLDIASLVNWREHVSLTRSMESPTYSTSHTNFHRRTVGQFVHSAPRQVFPAMDADSCCWRQLLLRGTIARRHTRHDESILPSAAATAVFNASRHFINRRWPGPVEAVQQYHVTYIYRLTALCGRLVPLVCADSLLRAEDAIALRHLLRHSLRAASWIPHHSIIVRTTPNSTVCSQDVGQQFLVLPNSQ